MLARHSLGSALVTFVLKCINSAFFLRILRGVFVEAPDASFLEHPGAYTAEFLSTQKLREYAQDPNTHIRDAFLDQALARGGQCYAIRDGETLAAYGWYSSR